MHEPVTQENFNSIPCTFPPIPAPASPQHQFLRVGHNCLYVKENEKDKILPFFLRAVLQSTDDRELSRSVKGLPS